VLLVGGASGVAWLRGEAERLGLPAIAVRPWDTVLSRVIAAVDRQ